MSWTNHLNSRSARVGRIEYRWRLRRKIRRATAAGVSADCAHNTPPVTATPPRGTIGGSEEPRTTCLLNPANRETITSPATDPAK